MDREKDPIYELDGKISFEKAIPFGLQHVLAMFVANIAPILIVAGAVKLSTEETGALVQAAMIIAGIGSLFQLYPLGPLGSGLPSSWESVSLLSLPSASLVLNMVMVLFWARPL